MIYKLNAQAIQSRSSAATSQKNKRKPHPLLGLAGQVAKKSLPLESFFQMVLPGTSKLSTAQALLCYADNNWQQIITGVVDIPLGIFLQAGWKGTFGQG